MIWKELKMGFQNINKVEYNSINLGKLLIFGMHWKVSNFKEFTKLTEILIELYI